MRMKWLTLAASLIVMACGGDGEEQGAAADTASANANTTGMRGMQGMQDMQGMNMGASQNMMQEMQSHMQMMEGAQGDSLRNMAVMHRQMAANMLSQMNRDMEQMNMGADVKWNALADSVRQDLTRMPEWSMQEIHATMSAHMGRMRRLMGMHSAMMKNM